MVHTPEVRHKILVVDDDRAIVVWLETILKQAGYDVTGVDDGARALSLVANQQPDLIVLDLDMPSVSGFEVCRQLKSDPLTRFIPIIVLTGHGLSAARLRAWDLGADEFLAKPPHVDDVLGRCRSLLRLKRLTDELDSAQAVLFAFARAVEAKSPYTMGHTERVTRFAVQLAAHVHLPEPELEVLRRGALLHDIGKIGIPDAILNKPARLTEEEYAIVKQHPIQGVRIVEPLHSLQNVLPFIRWHHERLDGKGYPDGLHGDAIPVAVRILQVADVYDALSSERPYRPKLAPNRCLEMLYLNAADGGLDPALVASFSEIMRMELVTSELTVSVRESVHLVPST